MTLDMNKYVGEGFKKSSLHRFVNRRLDHQRDVKILITSRNAQTGTGKTTLAIHLARAWDRSKTGWNAEDKSAVNSKEYRELYRNLHKGSVLVWDDAETGADKRRSMSSENVSVSHHWMLLRYREIVTIATFPSPRILDARMMELADSRINICRRGKAYPYMIVIDDFTGKIKSWRFRTNGVKDTIRWKKIPESDEDFKKLGYKKGDYVRGELTTKY